MAEIQYAGVDGADDHYLGDIRKADMKTWLGDLRMKVALWLIGGRPLIANCEFLGHIALSKNNRDALVTRNRFLPDDTPIDSCFEVMQWR